MAGRGLVGCVGAIVGIVAGVVVGWLTLDLILTLYGSVSGYGPTGPFRDAVVWHQIGQLAIFTALIAAILGAVLRPWRLREWLPILRLLLWVGAALEIAAWFFLPSGSRAGIWALLLALIALPTPWLIARNTTSAPPRPPA